MRILLFLLASLAYGQSEFGASAIRLLPRSADTDTGILRFYEYSSGGSRIDLKGQVSLTADKILRLPGEDGVLIADENHRYGTDSFTITGNKARGTEASPSDVSSGDVLFQFLGNARSGGAFVNAGSITFGVDAVSPSLDTSVNFGLTVGGSYGTRFAMDKDKFYGVGRPNLGLSSAGGRWGTLYGDSADFLVPTGSSPQYETGSFIRAQSLELYDSAGYSGGFKFQVTNTPAGNSKMELLDASASPVMRFTRVDLSGTPVSEIDSYMSIIPATIATYDLGSSSKPWSFIYGATIESTATLKVATGTGLGVDTDFLPTADLTYKLGDTGRRWDEAWIGTLNVASCTGCSGGSGSAPLNEVKITDYGADDTCTTAITAGSPSPWSQAYDVAKLTGGYVTFPAGGCYGIDAKLVNGNSLGTSESTDRAIIFKGAGAAYNPSGLAPATEIRWIGSAPGSPTPMIEFAGPINAGGIEGILLNANNTANVYYVNQRHHGYGTFRNVWAKRSPVSPSWIVTTSSSSYPYGACYNRYDQLHITSDGVAGAGGIYLTGATNVDACSNLFTDGEVWYDGDTAGTYGIKLDYADNNTFLRFNFNRYSPGPSTLESSYNSGSKWAVSCNTSTEYCTLGASNSGITNGARVRLSYCYNDTPNKCVMGQSMGTGALPTGVQWAFPYFVVNTSGNSFQLALTSGGSAVDITAAGLNVIVYLITPGVLLERYSGDTSFPKENAFYSSAIHNGVWSPNPPTGGNDFPEFQPDDCYVSPCIPNLDYIWGKAKGQMLGSGNTPPGVEVSHSDSQNTFRINQASGLYNGAGSIAFQRNSSTLGRIRSHYSDGLVFSTSSGGGAATERWRISDSGNLLPSVDATPSVGNATYRVDQFYGRSYRSYTNNAYNAQSNIFTADHNLNFDLKAYGSSGNDYRAGINFYRSRGSAASVSPVAAFDRLGVMAFWYNTATGSSESMSVGGKMEMMVDGYSGGSATTSFNFYTANAGSVSNRWKILGAGHLVPAASSINVGGDGVLDVPVNRVYSIDFAVSSSTGAVYPTTDGWAYVGLPSFRFYKGYIDEIIGRTGVTLQNGGSAIFQVSPTSLALVDTSGTLLLGANSGGTTVHNTIFTGTIQAPSGVSGFNGTLSCGSGQAVKTIVASYGILTSATCGAP